ncbi:hypothetical protein H6F74_22670 [Trichocoleus sp. FACHB-90]|uniref:hypothetical protein n=1 Tax=Cyanophyceae TaxID=3028117 RepID=UPI0016862917|nr:hypothetical protein [Trichocoleus sp. FACHB-90]MBD1929028.1 hypothetical protein [Trichocoleus sp. FACHB-90]
MKDIQHVTVAIAGSYVDLFQLPDGSRVGSLSSTAQAIGKVAQDVSHFLSGNSPEAAPYKGLTFHKIPVKRTQIASIPLEVMVAYWSHRAEKGNIQAKSLIRAVTQEVLERRLDGALGIHQTEAQYEEQTTALREKLIVQAVQANIDIEENRNNEELYQMAVAAKNTACAQMNKEEFKVYCEKETARRLERPLEFQPVGLADFKN